MRVLFLGLNYAPEAIGIGPYSTGLCQTLADGGHQVTVITAKPYYPHWRIFEGFRSPLYQRAYEGRVEVIRCPLYVPAEPTGLRRLLHHFSFALAALLATILCSWRRRDLVVATAPSLLCAPVAVLAARLWRANCWLHVQDFEVEAAFATGLLDSGSRVAKLGRGFERRVIRSFDRVSSISPEMCAKLVEMGIPAERVIEFRNWAEVDAVRPAGSRTSPFRDEWRITTPHVALYSGNIANKQGLEVVIEAARLLAFRDDITFVICGDGPNLTRLKSRSAGLANIRYKGLQPFSSLGDLLALATIHLLPQKASAADLVLPSKLTNMLASGKPVIATAAAGSGLAREVEGCGIVVEPEDPAAFAAAIELLIDQSRLHADASRTARERALERWSKQRILSDVIRVMEDVTEQPRTQLSPAVIDG